MPDVTPLPELARRPAGEQPVESRHRVNGVTLACFEWAGEGAPILLAHATGFHARVWDEVARRLPGRRVIAVDLRGHGRSDKPSPPYEWHAFGEDIAALMLRLDLAGVIGVGHSMGGHTVAEAAMLAPERFATLVLVDPTIFRIDPAAAAGVGAEGFTFVAKRRNEWTSPEEMIERFQPRFPFSVWVPEALRDYAVYGLLPAAGGGYVLACPPAIEAAILAGRDAPGADLFPRFSNVTIPVRVLRTREAKPGVAAAPFTTSPTAPDLASCFPRGTDVSLPYLSHFVPMQAPDIVARHILEAASAIE